ncbi:MAG: type II CAAX prenyl endopeptidase Rce1 family protein [Acidobacteriota bacterium]
MPSPSPHFWIPTAIAAALAIFPILAFGLVGPRCIHWIRSLPIPVRIAAPSVFAAPYLIVSLAAHTFAWPWLILYLLIPPAIAAVLHIAARLDPQQRAHWLDFLILVPLGLSVDLRWLQPAWPPRIDVLGKLILLNSGLYGFLAIRQLSGVGYTLRFRLRDLRTGLREFLFYAPIAIPLGLALGFLHLHSRVAHPWLVAPLWIYSFFAVALPEEIFFRGWMQNLLERRLGRTPALLLTAALFGLSHFNKHALHFNGRYVLLAAIAGIFYGRAWRTDRRVPASAITHATVDTLWGALFH